MNATKSLLRDWDGPLTRELALRPAAFGLARTPGHLQAEAATS